MARRTGRQARGDIVPSETEISNRPGAKTSFFLPDKITSPRAREAAMEPGSVISVHLEDLSGLDAVRKAAWVACHRKAALEIVVGYRPPRLRSLVRWHSAAPPELRWRVTGSVFAENLAAEADAVAKREGVAPDVRIEELARRPSCRAWVEGRGSIRPHFG